MKKNVRNICSKFVTLSLIFLTTDTYLNILSTRVETFFSDSMQNCSSENEMNDFHAVCAQMHSNYIVNSQGALVWFISLFTNMFCVFGSMHIKELNRTFYRGLVHILFMLFMYYQWFPTPFYSMFIPVFSVVNVLGAIYIYHPYFFSLIKLMKEIIMSCCHCCL